MTARTLCVALCVVAGSAGSSFGFVSWTNGDGAGADFTYTGGGSDLGLFGDPQIAGNTLIFSPGGFRAESQNGGVDTISDRLEFTIHVNSLRFLEGIVVQQYGDYGVLGEGASVDVVSTLSLTNLVTSDVRMAAMGTNPATPITISSAGPWYGVASVDVSSEFPGWMDVTIEFATTLTAASGPGSQAFIKQDLQLSTLSIAFIPEPATILLMAPLAVARLRRRSARRA